ncbi:MAG TPA: TIR domain-containing protein [Pyrinomonadaceae bacterium]
MSQDAQQKKLTLFLSYGQRDAATLAQHLHNDLKDDYHVWQDKKRIRVGWGWTDEIREGLKSSDILLALLSPHAVRRVGMPGNPDDKDSVCLDEIAYAVDSCRIPVVPVMALTCEPPLRIFRVQYLDFRKWEEAENYKTLLGQLRKTLAEVAASRRSRMREWDWLPEPRDFGAFLAEKRRRFTGREWLFRAVEKWRADGDGSRALLITGDPGAGKSAIVAALVHANPGEQVLAYHCCQADTKGTLDPARFVRSLAGMLAARLEGYAAMLEHRPLREALEVADAKKAADAFEEAILNPLKELPAPEGGTRYLLIDALDEAATRTEGPTIIDLLATRLDLFPSWLKLVATTRTEMLGRLKILQPQTISADAPENQDDVRRYVEQRLAEPGLRAKVEAYEAGADGAATFEQKAEALKELLLKASQKKAEALKERLLRASRNDLLISNFLYVVKVLEAVAAGTLTFAQVEALPPGLGGLYYEFFKRLYGGAGVDFAPTLSVLQAVVAAQESPTREELAAATGLHKETELPQVMSRLASFVPARNKRYVFFHKSLRDWLTGWDETTELPVAQNYYVSAMLGHERWAALYWARYEKGTRPLDARTLRYLPTHLAGAERWDDLAAVLLDRHFLEAKAEGPGTTVFDLLGDFTLAVEKMPEEHERRRIVALLGEVLRLDAQFIGQHPSTLFQCCWNRGFWHDSPRAASFFEAADGGAKGAPPWKQPGEKLHEFVERWRAEKELESPGFLWLRALRPMPEILGSAQRAVLHGHDDGLKCVDVSPDGLRIVSGSGEGSASVKLWDARSGAELQSKEYGEEQGISAMGYTTQGDEIVAARSDGTLLFLDAETLEELDSVPTGSEQLASLSISPDGSRLAVGDWNGVVRLWDVKQRKELYAVKGHGDGTVEALAFAPGGALLASGDYNYGAEGNLVRLWQVGEELAPVATYKSKGWVQDVTFSPDGKTLVWSDYDGNIEFRELEGKGEWSVNEDPATPASTLLFLPGGERLLCGAGGAFRDAPIALWNLKERRVERRFTGHVFGVEDMTLFPNGKSFVSAGDATVRVWNLGRTAGVEIRNAEPWVDHLLFVPGGAQVVTAAEKSEVAWIRPLSGDAPVRRLEGHTGGVHGAAVSADGSLLACGTGEGAVHVWDAANGGELLSYKAHTDAVEGLAFSPDGGLLASGSQDGKVIVYDLKAEEKVATYTGHKEGWVKTVAFSPDGSRVASGGNSIRVWNVNGKGRSTILKTGEFDSFSFFCFTPDGKSVVEGVVEALTAWDSKTGKKQELTEEHRAAFERSKNRLVKDWVWEGDEGEVSMFWQWRMTLTSAETGEAVGWLPLLRGGITHHPSGRIWANKRANQVWIFALEGAA